MRMRDSSDEEGAKSLLSQQRRITAQTMHNWTKHRQAANHIPCTRSEKLRKLHRTQRTLAKDNPNSILSNDMPDNEDKEADTPPQLVPSGLAHMPLFTSELNDQGIPARLVNILVLSVVGTSNPGAI